jgi:signal transduction protein with GAF and PtsI domain
MQLQNDWLGRRGMTEEGTGADELLDIEFLHEIGSRMAAADPFHVVLERVVEFVSTVAMCDSCFIYVLEQEKLVLRASKNPHADLVDELDLPIGQGITGWVAMHQQPVVIASQAWKDSRFKMFNDLPEDQFEAFLSVPILCRGKLIGVINVQHRKQHNHSQRQVRLLSTIGFLVGAELEMARLESERLLLTDRLEVRKLMDRAKGILQRELHLDEEGAYLALQKQSRQKRKAIREIAEAIILTDEIRRSRK